MVSIIYSDQYYHKEEIVQRGNRHLDKKRPYEKKTLFASFCNLALYVLNVLFTCSACIHASAIFSALAKNHAFNHFYIILYFMHERLKRL